jgi:diacylglycerol O-acyltransferase / wax synthase
MAVPMDPVSAAFMFADSRSTPMHVGGLQLFRLPEDAGPEWVRAEYERSVDLPEVAPIYRKRPTRSVRTAGQWFWRDDTRLDLEHHVRLSALPEPGRIRELLELGGRLHSTRMGFDRPLWEIHFITGLADGRVAMYSKIHHALVDGVAAMRLLQSGLTTDPDERDMPPAWAVRPKVDKISEEREALAQRLMEVPLGAVRSAWGLMSDAAGMPSALVKTLNRGVRNESAPIALYAPRTILNRKISGSRRIAAQDWEVDRLRAVGKATRTTMNDVVLAMCAGALRHYLIELDALPDQPLIAMVPMSLKLDQAGEASSEGGNAVGAIMVKLHTDQADPATRLTAISRSVKDARAAVKTMSQLQLMAMSGLGISPLVLAPMLGIQGMTRPPFNLVISNVPGPRKPLYMNGARLEGMYPLSIPTHGQAMNITCTSYGGRMNFGLTGCRRTAPSLQRLLTHLDDELVALEEAAGVS